MKTIFIEPSESTSPPSTPESPRTHLRAVAHRQAGSLRGVRARPRLLSRLFVLVVVLTFWIRPTHAAEGVVAILQKGLFEEEANQNLEAAIQAYQTVIAQAEEQRKIAATAVFRLGECYRKKGLTNEATAQYQRVLRDYSDQPTLANISRQNLTALGGGGASPTSTNAPSSFGMTDLSLNLEKAQADEKSAQETREIERMQKLLRDSPDLINAQDPAGQTPLHLAASREQLKVARFLLEHRADPNIVTRENRTPLYVAVQREHLEMVELLLSHRADPNRGGPKPLCLAAERGLKTIAEKLLDAKANVNAKQKFDYTALHLAVQNGHKSLAELLLSRGADLNAHLTNLGQPDFGGEPINATPLHLAVLNNRPILLEWLCANKADVQAKGSQGLTALHFAARKGYDDAAEILLKYQADPNPITEWGSSLLFATGSGSRRIVELLLEKGVDPNEPQMLRTTIQREDYPLNYAVMSGNLDLVKFLLEHKTRVQIPAFPPLMTTIAYGQLMIAGALIEAGADVNLAETTEFADRRLGPLQYAVLRGQLAMVELLLKHQADANRVNDGTGNTPLHDAVAVKQARMVALLADHANPNRLNKADETPLTEALAALLARGVNRPGPVLSPSDRQSLEEIVKILRDHGAREEYARLAYISVKYAARNPVRVFRKDAAGRNRFTLMDVLSLCPKCLQPAPRPDWTQVVIKRLDPQTLAEKSQPCPLPLSASETADWRDLPLEWGDVVEIPERVALVGDQGDQQLPAELAQAMTRCANRKVNVEIRGEKAKLQLTPDWPSVSYRDGYPFAERYDRKDVPVFSKEPFIRNFWLLPTMHNSELLLNTSDLTRVKVLRPTGGTTQEFAYNLETVTFPDDLWLQDGDTIVVPDKEK